MKTGAAKARDENGGPTGAAALRSPKIKKAKKGGKGKRAKTPKLPKMIAGVAIPEALRDPAVSLAGLLETPVGRQIIADVLVAVAAALVARNDTPLAEERTREEAALHILPSAKAAR